MQSDNEKKFFLALPKRKVQKGAFLGWDSEYMPSMKNN